jgi:diguanylate cyclase (GGDEF)-like protein/PAS domain S-box-containing protein
MTLRKVSVYDSVEEEMAVLLDVLRETGERLEELTGGEVDTAIDREGRTLLLRGTREQLRRNEANRQSAILNALPAHIALLDPSGTIVSVNNGWRQFLAHNTLGGGPEQGIGINYLAVCDSATGPGSDEAHATAKGIRSVLNGDSESFAFDYKCDSPLEERWFQLIVSPLSSESSKGVVITHTDITSSKLDESNLIALAERLSLATDVARVGVWEWDTSSDLLQWDETMYTIYGLPQKVPMSYANWAAKVHPEDLPEVEAKLQRTINHRNDQRVEFRITAGDGSMRYVSASERAVIDPLGGACRVIGVNVDVTERRQAEEELRLNQETMTHVAEHDFLTGLPNQRVLRDRLEETIKIAARNHTKVAVFFLDLNGFKHINDSLGHPVGDKLLQSIVRRLQGTVRASDMLCRFGGDEFIVLLPEVHQPKEMADAATRLLNAVASVHSVGEHELHVSGCIGISVYPDDGLNGETLIKNADAAMYHAKSKRGSNFQFFHADMNLRAIERQFIEQNLRRAMKRKELALNYQPKYDLRSGAIVGVEALLRWNHPLRGKSLRRCSFPSRRTADSLSPSAGGCLRKRAARLAYGSMRGCRRLASR